MELQIFENGGIQNVPQIAVQQIIYLDFDGALTSYDGEILSLDNVEVQDSGLEAQRIALITAAHIGGFDICQHMGCGVGVKNIVDDI